MDNTVVAALNNLPGFPPSQTFKLGEWLVQIATRPAVLSVGDLPTQDNQDGDARIVVEQAAWYVWVGGSWYSATGGGAVKPRRRVTTNTATLPTDFSLFVDASTGPITVTLTGATGSFFNVKKIDSTRNRVKLLPASGLLDGEPFIELDVRGMSVSVQADDDEWFII
jgi:hypothetical protein